MDFGLVFLFLLVTLFSIGSIGVMFSTLIRRTVVSMIATYGTMLFLTVITGFLFLIVMQLNVFGTGVPTQSVIGHVLASINPGVLMASLLSPEVDGAISEMTMIEFPIWAGYIIFYVLVAVLSLFIAVKGLRVNMKRLK